MKKQVYKVSLIKYRNNSLSLSHYKEGTQLNSTVNEDNTINFEIVNKYGEIVESNKSITLYKFNQFMKQFNVKFSLTTL